VGLIFDRWLTTMVLSRAVSAQPFIVVWAVLAIAEASGVDGYLVVLSGRSILSSAQPTR